MCVNTVYVNCLSGTIVRCVCADITTINHEAKLALKGIHATKRERERERKRRRTEKGHEEEQQYVADCDFARTRA